MGAAKEEARGGGTGSTARIRLAQPDVGAAELAAVERVLESGTLTMGGAVAELEAELARACEVRHAVAVSSGTAALHLSVLALELQPGDEVLVPAYTFPATANVVALAGLRPVLVDVDPVTMNVDPARVEAGPRTKAIVAVHLFGRPARIEELPDLPLLEDAAGALGARRRGRACGSLGIAGCLSFHPRKIVTTGEGGAVTTDDDRVAEAVRRLRNHGWRDLGGDMPAAGLNYRLADVLCAIGTPQVRRLPELLAARARIAAAYEERLRDLPVMLPTADDGDVHGWQAYVIQVERRDGVLAALRADGIEAQIGTYALHRLRPYREQGVFPGAEHAFEHALALPFHTALGEGELDRVAEALDKIVSNH
ncbi:MAG TPA: DegT/DnrJ/EryC1/StrS family aminotransferase [Gaiellaceae bacterium]|nr:DegT/DnrJ/EryC1/StrS family aminotransferase [Gaiellaceae bacterium]